MNNESAQKMWAAFVEEHPEITATYDVWSFGSTAESADQLARLVIAHQKTATTSNYALYRLTNEPVPTVGRYSVILDGHQQAVAIIRTTAIQVLPFGDVGVDQAYAEGEGDQTIAYWRNIHRKVFTDELAAVQKTFTDQSLVLLERFALLFHD
ncbi:ASCH domain-containing protein [Loigolactobacillus iwatensis]|uniref:ASCH domain-containing protein n=1 Tax=Loigolactobacillus iwatensis TaxID=1267156 RepID=UPI000F7EB21E|nr:ASCH domain-containing protein [Loigolactobacillus iwatensis]